MANDEIRSTLVKQAAPPGIKVNVVSVEKAGRVFKNPKYESEKVFLLFENPEDVVRSIKEGIDITILNVGGMQYKDGKLRVSKAVFVNHDDIKNFDILHEQGVTLDGRVVASDPKLDFYDELTKIKIREEI